MVFRCLPLRIKQWLVVQNYEEGKERYLDSLAFQVSRTLEFNSAVRNEHITSNSRQGVLQMLHQKGVPIESIPKKFGGLYDYNLQFNEFIRMRISIEEVMSAAPLSVQDILPSAQMRAITKVQRNLNESKEDYARRRNNVYARRVSKRRENELLSLEQRRDFLRVKNAALLGEKARLEALLAQAQAWVAIGRPAGLKEG
mmetsp:Transcript_15934/g.30325  ORF Transcript_15934/g.30325 Transcript_15934/m.30325 type:complete len:199 (-) Transcript_15934:240-836(-)